MTYTVRRWIDDQPLPHPTLAEQLRTRPGVRAVINEATPERLVNRALVEVREDLGSGYEVAAQPVDDGPHGLVYEITAVYLPDTPEA